MRIQYVKSFLFAIESNKIFIFLDQTLPFFGTLFKEWEISETYVIKGAVNADAHENFEISFFSDHQLDDNIAFRLSVRFTEQKVYRQSLVAGKWRLEESDGSFPFTLGKPFEIAVVARDDHYEVLVNGELLWTYTYTIELSRVTYVHIQGPVTIISIQPGIVDAEPTNPPITYPTTTSATVATSARPTAAATTNRPAATATTKRPAATTTRPKTTVKPVTAKPAPKPKLPLMCDVPYRLTLPVTNPTVPFLARIPYIEGKELGQRVVVRGTIKNNFPNNDANWIVIRLQPCPTGAKNDNVAVSVSIRFSTRSIVTFDQVDKKWTINPNRNNAFPVAKGTKFTVGIISDVGAYRININNKRFINHPYHNPRPRARFVRVFGPVTLSSVTYQRGVPLLLKKN